MRKFFRRIMPSPEWVRSHPTLVRLGSRLCHPRLWQLNRRAVAGSVAVGFFFAFIIPVGQFLLAAITAIALRVNLPIAMVSTLITNPITYAPWYWLAYEIGSLFVTPRTSLTATNGSFEKDLLNGLAELGGPLMLGLLILATTSALLGWLLVHLVWRFSVLWRWKTRRHRT